MPRAGSFYKDQSVGGQVGSRTLQVGLHNHRLRAWRVHATGGSLVPSRIPNTLPWLLKERSEEH